ncbi:7387_t:CDS:2 [Paraglomus occultum]|uniref:7387_t:CDS:1 n=1 Tax=Paraglomus occultum TaxID=144539 RepID=A0A9N9GDR7_9GLOM|nr:7387_t:CDS:2 [Paraglomus occultum]
MHENGRKHKENAERFLSNVYRREEEDQKEQERIKRELERIENAAMRQYKKDVALALPGSSLSSLRTAVNATMTGKASTAEEDAYYNTPNADNSFSQSVAIPISTTDIEQVSEVTEELPQNSGTEGVMGEWRPVTPPPRPQSKGDDEERKHGDDKDEEAKVLEDDDEDDHDDIRNFKLVEKTIPLEPDLDEKDKEDKSVTFRKRKLGTADNNL